MKNHHSSEDDEDDLGGYGSDKPKQPKKIPSRAPKAARSKAAPPTAGKTMAKSRKIPPAQVQRGKKRVEVVQDHSDDDNDDDDDDDDDQEDDKDDRMELSEKEHDKENQRPNRSVSSTKTKRTNQGASTGELEKEIIKLRTQLTRRTEERDHLSSQFTTLQSLRHSSEERLHLKYKTATDARLEVQEKTIAGLEGLNSTLTARVSEGREELRKMRERCERLENGLDHGRVGGIAMATSTGATANGPVPVPEPAPVPDAQAGKKGEEMELELKRFKAECKRLKTKVEEKETEVTTLKTDLEFEIQQSRSALTLAEKRATALALSGTTSGPTNAKEIATDLAENEKVIQLYEDLTNLLVNKVRIEKTGTPSGGEEVMFNCIQTIEGRSLNFKLRCYKKATPDPLKPNTNSWIYTKQMEYHPDRIALSLEKDGGFVDRLGVFADGFVTTMEKGWEFWESLKDRMMRDPNEGEGEGEGEGGEGEDEGGEVEDVGEGMVES